MKPLAWYQLNDAERRIEVAESFLWLSCIGGLVALVVGVVATLFGQRAIWSALAARPWAALASLAVAGHLVSLRGGWAVLGVVLVLRAWSALTSAPAPSADSAVG